MGIVGVAVGQHEPVRRGELLEEVDGVPEVHADRLLHQVRGLVDREEEATAGRHDGAHVLEALDDRHRGQVGEHRLREHEVELLATEPPPEPKVAVGDEQARPLLQEVLVGNERAAELDGLR